MLGLVVGIAIMAAGETTAEIDLTLEFEPLDGLWFIFGLPVLSVLLFVILSPLSFLIYRYVLKGRSGSRAATAEESAE